MTSDRQALRGTVRGRTGLVVACAWTPQMASAHLVDTGLGPIYDGISHLLLSPDDLLPVLALALLGGLNGVEAARRALWTLPLAWLIGGLAGFRLGSSAGGLPDPGLTSAVIALLLGALVAADRRLAPTGVVWLAAALGLVGGWLNGAGIAAAARSGMTLAGIGATVFVIVALVAAGVASIRARWARLAVRVAGSWIAAVGLLMLGWALRAGVP